MIYRHRLKCALFGHLWGHIYPIADTGDCDCDCERCGASYGCDGDVSSQTAALKAWARDVWHAALCFLGRHSNQDGMCTWCFKTFDGKKWKAVKW